MTGWLGGLLLGCFIGWALNQRLSPAEQEHDRRLRTLASMRMRLRCEHHGDVAARYAPVCPQCWAEAESPEEAASE